jgi:hypothetical protein
VSAETAQSSAVADTVSAPSSEPAFDSQADSAKAATTEVSPAASTREAVVVLMILLAE